MIAMQYNISLPGDYDMEIIRKRVRDNGSKTDGFPHLAMKAYLVAEKGRYRNCENQYAPFYLWERAEGMNQFLLGGPFDNIVSSFGWPRVANWVVLHAKVEKDAGPQFALVETMSIPRYSSFGDLCGNEEENFLTWAADPATRAYVTAYNPDDWKLCRFHLSTDLDMLQKLSRGALLYNVHHVS